ncbi:MAG: hypothetical protein Q8O61_13255 [Nocardioides sp.]|nr:hypothetical protein [Nocardioides sp.]
MSLPFRRLAGLALCAAVLSGCGTGDDDVVDGGVSGDDATAALEGQREEVRQAAADLVTGAVAALGGRASNTTGGFEGCESTFNDQYRTFQYRASGRVDAGKGASRPFLDALGPVLTGSGFGEPVAGERPGGQTLSAERDDLSATFSELPGQGDYVLLAVEGPCVEVPEDDRDDWQRRTDPTPYL